MIYYCEQCKQYWKDELNLPFDWVYCTIDGIQISLCLTCIKEAGEVIKNPMPESDSDIDNKYEILIDSAHGKAPIPYKPLEKEVDKK